MGWFNAEDIRREGMLSEAPQLLQPAVFYMGFEGAGQIAHAAYHELLFHCCSPPMNSGPLMSDDAAPGSEGLLEYP
jgi:hypothetical protein